MKWVGNGNMDFMMSEIFIQVIHKLNKKLQLHVEIWVMPQ
jgi:hypothetical protein